MSSKPVVAFLMPEGAWKKMFAPEALDLLRSDAELVGPLPVSQLLEGGALADAAKPAKVIVTGWGTQKIDAEVLQRLPDATLVAHSAGSVKGVASDALYDRGMTLTTAAGENAVPVAQFTVMMMVSMLKQVPWIHPAHTSGDVEEVQARRKQLRELQDMEIGLIGASRVGREVIKLLKPYPGLTIKVYDPYLQAEAAAQLGVTLVSLEEVCACEVVSVHAPNIPETRHMLNERTLGLMPDHCVLVNTARGALIDETALLAEMQKRPLYAALDVTKPEPPPADSPLRRERNVVLTPHIAGAQNQSCKAMGRLALEEARRHLNGEPPLHAVTREMLATQA